VALQTLKSIVAFLAVPNGASAAIAHGLTVNGHGVVPDEIKLDNGNFTLVSCDDTFLTLRNDSGAVANCSVLCEFWHSFERAFGASQSTALNPAPFVADTAGLNAIKTVIAHGGVTATGPSISFQDGNGVTFGVVGNTITASVQTVGGTATGVAISAGTELATTGAVVFSNSNNITFGMHLSTVTASAYQAPILKPVGYTAAGGETDFSVTFPSVGSTDYSVYPALNGVSMIVGLDLPAGGANRANTAFRVVPTAGLQAGDQLAFLLVKT
jgi:hypothetical protein